MRSRALRLIIGVIAGICLIGSAFFLLQLNRQFDARNASWHALDARAREVTSALADARVAQQSYLAPGQDVGYWLPRVETLVATARQGLAELERLDPGGRVASAVSEANSQIAQFVEIDRRARDLLASDQPVMASDLVLAEGGQTARAASRLIEQLRIESQSAFDSANQETRRMEAIVAGSTAALMLLIILLFAAAPSGAPREEPAAIASLGIQQIQIARPIVEEVKAVAPPPSEPVLSDLAEICTMLGRSEDSNGLNDALGRAAALMNATGLIVWIGDADTGDLRPAAAHGYQAQFLAKMASISRSADNAVATSYRTGAPRTVSAASADASAAIVVPLLSTGGCIGALTAELRTGTEPSDPLRALATIIGAQLASLLAVPAPTSEQSQERAASA